MVRGRQIPPALPSRQCLVSPCSLLAALPTGFSMTSFQVTPLLLAQRPPDHLALLLPAQLQGGTAQFLLPIPLQGENSHSGDDLCVWRTPNAACSCGKHLEHRAGCSNPTSKQSRDGKCPLKAAWYQNKALTRPLGFYCWQ